MSHPPTAIRQVGRASAALFALLMIVLQSSAPAGAIPVRGNTPWSVILCKYKGTTVVPQPISYFQQMFTTAGTGLGGEEDYFRLQSYGSVRLVGSVVRGWYTMPYTKAQEATKSRWDKINDCVATAAAAGYTVPAGNRIAAITNESLDGGSAGGRVLLDPGSIDLAFAAHEMGHGYGLGHSFSNDLTYQNASWSAPGEYDDPWDLMSAMHIYNWSAPRFVDGAVGLNAYMRDKLGWLPRNQVVTLGADGVGARTVDVTALEASTLYGGPRLVRIPFDPADAFHYYTVEYRLKSGASQGIPANTVLIHEVKNGIPSLIRQLAVAGKPQATSLSANGVTITTISQGSARARIAITSDITRRCVQGYVWREARVADVVCVTGAVRAQTRADNAVAASRWVSGPYGPHTCVNGYVWREAFVGDDVCVTGVTRTQARLDNGAAASRANPARFVYGPNTCAPGYVWRDADQKDYVCVTGATRARAALDNALAASRWVSGPYGPHTCRAGYVWREGWPGDDVCTTVAIRSQTRSDNAAAASRVLRPGG